MSEIRRIQTPLDDETIRSLRSGGSVLLSGVVYTARDAAHKRMFEAVVNGLELPFDLKGQVIYYVGPTPARPGRASGSAGPTTAGRMDAYAPKLMELGLKGMIGKGSRNAEVKSAIKKYWAVYFAATGGAGALLAQCIQSSEIIAYEDLGAEAVRRLIVKDLPLIIVNDIYGGDLYEEGISKYRRPLSG